MSANASTASLEIIAFRLGEQDFCIRTTAVREIRGWCPSMPIPNAPDYVLGVINLRGNVIPTIDLSHRLGMVAAERTDRSAIVVAEAGSSVIGLVVDQVTDMLTVPVDQLQPVPDVFTGFDSRYCDGIITHETGMICFVNLGRLFENDAIPQAA
ncbi:chemotaxis protein CheW [Rhizobium sp. SSA_523]|uniref:chemotaxis protein CheW n=1 Tax=Rhizobium sp. SSA_523 TaxID=2952477 RepID=UPI002091CFFC|nr:chemotaxis protein CheW [Rhizobium sp. SSA_523]MCO5730584.1 chemotaxis protein CheW [Rhizobium sp. SSA_523]WKC25875.1 chemotaxis protein CheW [Rhizobium sp. SSA_523]